jgi:hypothetical protein
MPNTTTEPEVETLAETENYIAWKAEEPDSETTFHLELGNITLNFFQEEWDEFLEYAGEFKSFKPDEDGFFAIDFYNVAVWLDGDDWTEFKTLIDLVMKPKK